MSLAALLVACDNAHAQQPRRACRQQFTKPRLEVIHDNHFQESDPVRVRSAIQELGEMRCVEVIDDLISLLTFRFPFPKDASQPGAGLDPVYTGTRYPATGALLQIRKPALPALVKVIETNEADSLAAKNARYTVRVIFRDDEESRADAFFKEQAAKASTPEAKRRLLRALETAQEDMRSD